MAIHILYHYRFIKKPNGQTGFGDGVIKGLTDHVADFPAPDVPVANLILINNTYRDAITAAEHGDEIKIEERNKYFNEIWLPAFDETAAYVSRIAGSNPALIIAAGYRASKETKGKKHHVEAPVLMLLQVSSPGAGVLLYKSDTKVTARHYLLIGRMAEETSLRDAGNKLIFDGKNMPLYIIPVTKKKGRVTGLPSGKKMIWQILALNRAGAGPPSQEVPLIIQ